MLCYHVAGVDHHPVDYLSVCDLQIGDCGFIRTVGFRRNSRPSNLQGNLAGVSITVGCIGSFAHCMVLHNVEDWLEVVEKGQRRVLCG